MLNQNQSTEIIQETATELQDLGSEMTQTTSFTQRKQLLLSRHIDGLVNNNRSWISRIMLPTEDKAILKEYAEKQQEAANLIMTSQNKSLAALCGAQVTFVKEVVNTLLKTGRAGLKAGSDVIFTEYRNQRAQRIETLANQFYDLIEMKLRDAEGRPAQLQALKLKEVEIDLKKWEEDYILLQDEFSNILREQQ